MDLSSAVSVTRSCLHHEAVLVALGATNPHHYIGLLPCKRGLLGIARSWSLSTPRIRVNVLIRGRVVNAVDLEIGKGHEEWGVLI